MTEEGGLKRMTVEEEATGLKRKTRDNRMTEGVKRTQRRD